MLTGIAFLLIVVLAVYIYYNFRKKVSELSLQHKQEIEAKNSSLHETSNALKAAQSQLIQSEKMAALGEMTAGIAHEIQNPLNFVNNFAEVNSDMIDDIRREIGLGNTAEALALADDVKKNNEKIAHHGKRADSIIKGMLQHSRKNTGIKEPTDLNALVDEYLRLSFHGLKAADKSFNAYFKTCLDPTITTIPAVRQDIGRVLLNFFNNAFFAIAEKKTQIPEGYEPTLTVSTKKQEESVLLTISDNGNGIPDSVREKIFQPFFTTKPSGKGTGLGLSISYEIITKIHGGKISIDSKEGEYTKFLIELPVN
ncbi:MAG: ATP-binding protein [Bacteroidota bacterium]